MQHKVALGVAALGVLLLAMSGDEEDEEKASVGWAPPEDCDEFEQLFLLRLPVDVTQLETPKPTCGFFHQVRKKEIFLGTTQKSITYVALRQAAKRAALEGGLDERKASKFAEDISRSSFHRLALFTLIVCGGWNDAFYGTYGYRVNTPAAPHGRGIDLRSCHFDNRSRLMDGQSPLRGVPCCEPKDSGSGIAEEGSTVVARQGSYPYLWIPPLDLEALYRSEVTTRGLKWTDGSSQIDPPPEVRILSRSS